MCICLHHREIVDYYRETTGKGEMTPFLRLMAGAGAGIVAMSATYPLDMVRGRLTVQEGTGAQYRGIWHATRVIVKEVREALRMEPRASCLPRSMSVGLCALQEGPLALYKGWTPSVLGVIPYVGLNFAVYETLKASLIKHYGEAAGMRVPCFPERST